MTRIQLFYSRAYPGNALRANTLQALAHLGVNPEVQAEETVPEQLGRRFPHSPLTGKSSSTEWSLPCASWNSFSKNEYRSGRRIFPAARAAWDAAA